jgi:hypothetical protein
MRIAIRALIITSVLLPIPAMGLDLYVATNGNDSWNGRQAEPGADKAGPFATLERARDEFRKLRGTAGLPGGPATVHVRGGIHSLSSRSSPTWRTRTRNLASSADARSRTSNPSPTRRFSIDWSLPRGPTSGRLT